MQKPFRIGVRSVASDLAILFSAMGMAGGCMFGAKVTEADPAGTGGSTFVMHAGGKEGGTGGTGTGGAPSLTKDAGTCIREPGQDTCMSVCKIESHLPDRLLPDILIVLDKSQSMTQSTDNATICTPPACQSKWVQVTDAIINVVTATDKSVNWGLKYFGSDNQCGVTAGVEVPVAVANHDPIATSIMATTPMSRTPTRAGMNAAVAYLKTLKDTAPKFIVLATDGAPNCAPDATGPTTAAGGRGGMVAPGGPGAAGLGADDAATIQAVADALKAGFPTYVVGISTANTPAETTLNSMAKAGGVARAAAPYFYSVTSSADLETSLKAIAGKVATCNYPLAPVSATNDPNNVAIHISGASVPQDPQNGWDFTGPDHTAIKLSGTACEKVMNSADTKVEVFYGCPGDPPVP